MIQNNRKMVNTILFRVDLIKFRKKRLCVHHFLGRDQHIARKNRDRKKCIKLLSNINKYTVPKEAAPLKRMMFIQCTVNIQCTVPGEVLWM